MYGRWTTGRSPTIIDAHPVRPLRWVSAEAGTTQFEGLCVPGKGERIFGGHTLAHLIEAADRSSPGNRRVSALHAVFVSAGRATSPVRYFARPVRLGRSIDVVQVDAIQAERVTATGLASFHDGESSNDIQQPAPRVAPPESCPPAGETEPARHPAVREPFEVRALPEHPDGDDVIDTWLRLRDPLPPEDASARHAALLAYAVDFVIARPIHFRHSGDRRGAVGASLNHAMWFHRPFRVDEWLHVRAHARSFSGSRSWCEAHVYDRSGAHVASASQELLLRP